MRNKLNGQAVFKRAVEALPPHMREFVKPTGVAHVWARGSVLGDKDAMTEMAECIREYHDGAVPVFHRIRRYVA